MPAADVVAAENQQPALAAICHHVDHRKQMACPTLRLRRRPRRFRQRTNCPMYRSDPRTYGNNIEEGTKHFCDFENLKNEYFQLKTEEFRLDPNLNYYFDPYKEMNVFIKKNY